MHPILPNSCLDPPAVRPRARSDLEIAPCILKQRSEVIKLDREKGIRGDVECCPVSLVSVSRRPGG